MAYRLVFWEYQTQMGRLGKHGQSTLLLSFRNMVLFQLDSYTMSWLLENNELLNYNMYNLLAKLCYVMLLSIK